MVTMTSKKKRMKIQSFLKYKFLYISIFFLTSVSVFGKTYTRDYFVPEPLYFDLVRNLGSKKGELEINTLGKFSKGHKPHYAPEIEYTFLNNHAIELELPTYEGKVTELKFAYQYTLPDFQVENYKHGLQFISEQSISDAGHKLTALYISAIKLNPYFGILIMNGFQRYTGVKYLETGNFDSSDDATLNLWNPSKIKSDRYLGNFNLFYDHSETWIFGLEINVRTNFKKENEYLVLPNIKYHITETTNFHFGLGVANELEQKALIPVAIARFVLEI